MEHWKAEANSAYQKSKDALLGTPIYGKIKWLEACVSRRAAEGKPLTKDYLANCSTMKQVTLGIYRDMEKRGVPIEKSTVKATRQSIGEEIAALILEGKC